MAVPTFVRLRPPTPDCLALLGTSLGATGYLEGTAAKCSPLSTGTSCPTGACCRRVSSRPASDPAPCSAAAADRRSHALGHAADLSLAQSGIMLYTLYFVAISDPVTGTPHGEHRAPRLLCADLCRSRRRSCVDGHPRAAVSGGGGHRRCVFRLPAVRDQGGAERVLHRVLHFPLLQLHDAGVGICPVEHQRLKREEQQRRIKLFIHLQLLHDLG